MSTYVVSDLHGYPLEKLINKLKEINFGSEDILYVLGDCIDRGSDGLKILKWIMSQPNITLILGNHEKMLLDNQFLFDGDTIPAVLDLVGEQRRAFAVWVSNGGDVTLDSLQECTDAQIKQIFKYLEKAPLYKEIECNGKKYILTHSGLGNFDKNKPLEEYTEQELLWNRPKFYGKYFDDGTIVVFGHTPTFAYGDEYRGKIIKSDTYINIDVGAACGHPPVLLRLDDKKVFYLSC